MTALPFGSSTGELLRSAGLARAFTLTTIAATFGAFAIERLTGRVTYVTIIAGLCLLAGGILIARRRELSPLRFAPISVLVFIAWAGASVVWSTDSRKSLGGWVSLLAFALLALTIAHVRDTLQTARAFGDVMRWLLSISLGVEILFGILLDMPFSLLGVQGAIADLGPVQGIFGTRNALGFIAVLALITFVVEWRTSSVPTGLSIFSVVLAGGLAILSDSPTVVVIATIVALATLALMLMRHATPTQRPVLQTSLGAVVVLGLIVAYLARNPIIAFLGAGSDFSTRADLWNTILDYVRFYPVQGWGWYGAWSTSEFPFLGINFALTERHASALNAYFDVLLQVGWLGLLLFLVVCGIALVRGWSEASTRRSVVYTWTPLILVALLVDSMFESFTLHGYGWMMLVLCAARAGHSRSWRDRVREPAPVGPELPSGIQGGDGKAG
ncbi:O-antigen ligase family protein [Microbacterium caowuchunii]|uniref:O-antigen ligase family protein n=1 Tax=Microbacterium caowuchunii TaxID=2614638 RepID=A0A5N0T8H6_9MICO|nr:O-antigen ligase family protein [Microbacterium caowuchunii]KAA9130126.1 O-antigen ligase family protein [Microbacterium caowuchunii]